MNRIRKVLDFDQLGGPGLPGKGRIVLVMDYLNSHHPASPYSAFPPEEATRIGERLEMHYAPKPGSWPNMAEKERGVLTRQCLDRWTLGKETLKQETQAGHGPSNRNAIRVDWRFTTKDTRIKLKLL